MKLSHEQVKHIARLARMGLSESETEKFRSQVSAILDSFEVLNQVDTTDVPAATHSIPLQNIFREDEVHASYPQEEILANAPEREGSFFKVQSILE
jgi:aspartyl-tRNA(Asn)/glutamyl-tRNA(Gln) amidotransferase subunit C